MLSRGFKQTGGVDELGTIGIETSWLLEMSPPGRGEAKGTGAEIVGT